MNKNDGWKMRLLSNMAILGIDSLDFRGGYSILVHPLFKVRSLVNH